MLREAEIRNGLRTSVFGQRDILIYDETGSTSDIAFRLGADSYPEGTIVIAESQTGGRGRHGRSWISLPGQSLSFSIILRPAVKISLVPGLTLVSAVALSDTLHRFSIHNHTIKWPNDILINSRKICGILNELKSSHDGIDFIITGIGINTGTVSDLLPPELKGLASSIQDETGLLVDRIAFLQDFLYSFEKRYFEFINSGLSGILQDWDRNSGLTGRMISVKTGSGNISGRVKGILGDGSLQLETDDGIEKIISGEIELL